MPSRGRILPDHPRVPVERTHLDNLLDGLAFGILLASWTIVLVWWPDLPDSVPRHFSLAGKPDAWGGKGFLLLLPGLGTLIFGLFIAIQRIPHHYNYPWPITPENAAVQYARARRFLQLLSTLIQGMFACIVYEMIRLASGAADGNIAILTPLFLLAIFSLILGYIVLGRRSPTHKGDSS